MKNIKLSMMSAVVALLILATSCNKDLEQFSDPIVAPATGQTLDQVLKNSPDDSLYYKMIQTAGMLSMFSDSSKSYTLFVPNNAVIRNFIIGLSGGFLNQNDTDSVFARFITAGYPAISPIDPVTGLNAAILQYRILISYNTVPQKLKATDIGAGFPNFAYPTIFNPKPTADVGPLGKIVRMAIYPSTNNGRWLNNIYLNGVDHFAINGAIHHPAKFNVPPTTDLWKGINSSADLTYLKAAIQRADRGVPNGYRIVDALSIDSNALAFGSNVTIFAPDDNAFKQLLIYGIGTKLADTLRSIGITNINTFPIATGVVNTYGVDLILGIGDISIPLPAPYDVITIPAISLLTTQQVQGIVVYHVLAAQSGKFTPPGIRVFSVNLPNGSAQVKTMLNSVIASHPGLAIEATRTGQVVSATVKGFKNSTAANVTTFDQQHVNGIIHKINQVLLPQ